MRSFVIVIYVFGLLFPILFLWSPVNSAENSILAVNVEVIKADRDSNFVDPELKALVKELGPVLNYTGFSLLKKSIIRIAPEGKEDIILPEGRLLKLQFMGYEDNKARLLVKIIENDQEIFRTTLLMVDKGSAMIGGPPHESGVLLLRIGTQFDTDTK